MFHSGFLDAFDGTAARALNQGTKFGAMLDQLTDRAALMCLLMVLGQLYPKYMLLFQVSRTRRLPNANTRALDVN